MIPTVLLPQSMHPPSPKWQSPGPGRLKFNVDRAVVGSFIDVVIGGILRDPNGNTLIKFSKSVVKLDPASAEIFAIKEAVSLFQSVELDVFNQIIDES
ncbi:hypothetical protein GQ457_16G007900 [Hibiscus cannabinus]